MSSFLSSVREEVGRVLPSSRLLQAGRAAHKRRDMRVSRQSYAESEGSTSVFVVRSDNADTVVTPSRTVHRVASPNMHSHHCILVHSRSVWSSQRTVSPQGPVALDKSRTESDQWQPKPITISWSLRIAALRQRRVYLLSCLSSGGICTTSRLRKTTTLFV